MTKTEILIAICEVPGWAPTHESSSIEKTLSELHEEGWIVPRLDGWEATARALECYPHFYVDKDGKVRGEHTVGPPRDELDRPIYDTPPAQEKAWEQEYVLPVMVIGPRQQVQAPAEVQSWAKGGIGLTNVRPDGQPFEVEVVLRLRRV